MTVAQADRHDGPTQAKYAHLRIQLIRILVVAALMTMACGSRNEAAQAGLPSSLPSPSSSWSDAWCRATAMYLAPSFTFVGSFEATASEIVQMEETPGPQMGATPPPFLFNSRFRAYPPNATMAICYYDGPGGGSNGPPGPPGPGVSAVPHSASGRWLVVRALNGTETLIGVGDPHGMVIQRRIP